MFAIVSIAGKQMKVTKGSEVFVDRLKANEGESLSFDNVLLIENEGNTTLGNPEIDNASVNVTVMEHVKGDKVIVFKKKRRKGYKKKNGHRQQFTKIKINSISL